jgi:hypothetical protein
MSDKRRKKLASPMRIQIEDDLATASSGAIEVVFDLEDGSSRWCYFMTPEALSNAGDWIPGTQIRFHYDNPHMIVVSAISEEIIQRVLAHLSEEGALERCSLVVGGI